MNPRAFAMRPGSVPTISSTSFAFSIVDGDGTRFCCSSRSAMTRTPSGSIFWSSTNDLPKSAAFRTRASAGWMFWLAGDLNLRFEESEVHVHAEDRPGDAKRIGHAVADRRVLAVQRI